MKATVIREYLPILERGINLTLYGKAAEFYKLLEENGFIDRLKKVEQLGVISQIEKSASHTRWEYMILQLYLIQKLIREERGRFGKIKELNIFGVEVLQLWVFLFNMGHPPGTFATIRGIVSVLYQDDEMLKEKVPKRLKDIFKKVVKRKDIFSFPKILSAIYLKELKENIQAIDDKMYDLSLKLLLYYFEEGGRPERIEVLKSYFEMIRRLSFLFLDLSHIRSPIIDIDISEIFLDPRSYDEMLEPSSQFSKTLETLEDLLSVTLYHSKITITQMGIHSKRVEEIFKEWLFKNGKHESFNNFIEEKKSKLYPGFRQPMLTFHVLLDLEKKEFRYLDKKGFHSIFYKLEEELNEEYYHKKDGRNNERKEALVTYQPGSNNKHIVINLAIYKENRIGKLIRDFVFKLSEILRNINKDIKKDVKKIKKSHKEEKLEFILFKIKFFKLFRNEFYPRFFKFILRTIFQKYSFKKFHFDTIEDRLFVGEKKELKKQIERKIQKIENRLQNEKNQDKVKELKSKKAEFKSLNKVIDNLKFKIGIIGQRINLIDQNRDTIGEFDGLGVIIDKNLEILFLEAKTSRAEKAENQLRDSMKKILNLQLDNDEIQSGKEKDFAYAYCIKR
ncbi:MAG: hypothetical protein QFX38_04575 [Methanothermobacter sp.]|nr:hypothetical protein [Methanothermobacter sp.]